MKKYLILLIFIFAINLVFGEENFKTSSDYVNEAKKLIEEIEPKEAFEKMEKENIVILDIREKDEIEKEGKIKNSFNIPRGILEFEIEKIPEYKDKIIYVYCSLGGRGALAVKTLNEMGYKSYNIKGGFSNWKVARMPIEK